MAEQREFECYNEKDCKMSWISELIGGGFKGLGEGVSSILSAFGIENAEDKSKIALEIQKLVAQKAKDSSDLVIKELDAKEKILVAELTQGDDYTKRARPTVVYAGLAFIILNHILLPWASFFFGLQIPKIEIPDIFWQGWAGIVITWSIGRTVEKKGGKNKITKAITGS